MTPFEEKERREFWRAVALLVAVGVVLFLIIPALFGGNHTTGDPGCTTNYGEFCP